VGTRKGVWVGTGSGAEWQWEGPRLSEAEVASVGWLPGGSLLAGTMSWFWGTALRRSDDGGATWQEVPGIGFGEADGASLERVWTIEADPFREGVVWAGCEPHSLWRSDDGGRTFALNRGLWDHPHHAEWMPGQGGGAVHTVVPRPDGSVYVAMSTGGVYRSLDEGASWEPRNRGIRVEFAPEKYPEFNQCVHRLAMDGADPDLMWVQNHGGVFRSTDAGATWDDVGAGLPADFGFVVLAHPVARGTAWVLPIDGMAGRVPVGGELRAYRTTDGGAGWEPCGGASGSWNAVLRDAAHVAARPDGTAVVAYGSRDGCVYVSEDDGRTFTEVARHLSDVLSVRVAV